MVRPDVPSLRFPSSIKEVQFSNEAYPLSSSNCDWRRTSKRISSSEIPALVNPSHVQTDVWSSILCLYNRLGAAYDHFYQVLGFLSPNMKTLLQELQKSYANSYQTSPLPEYAQVYASTGSSQNIATPYCGDDYPEAYSRLLFNPILGGVWSG